MAKSKSIKPRTTKIVDRFGPTSPKVRSWYYTKARHHDVVVDFRDSNGHGVTVTLRVPR